jgi:hypothetical protein
MKQFFTVFAACVLAGGLAACAPADSTGDGLASTIDHRVGQAVKPLLTRDKAVSVADFEGLVSNGSWTEAWPDGRGGQMTVPVQGKIWNPAIAAALAKHGAAYLPKREQPYYLDGPIVLRTGQRLLADRDAEIRLKPGVGTCMVRNEHVVGGHQGPVPGNIKPDTDILIEGGIWTTLNFGIANNNNEVRSAVKDGVPGCYGTILLSNVRRVAVRNLTVRHGSGFGMHLTNCSDFLVEGVTFDEHGRDGVHVNGPAHWGVIRDLRGITADDYVALNAWDWLYSTPTFGPIDHVLVEKIYGDVREKRPIAAQAGPEGTAEIRVLPGVKNFPSHVRLDCPVNDCVFRDLYDIRTFKIYDQPNLEMGRDKDFSDPIGTVQNLWFSKLTFSRPGVFQLAADVDGLYVDDVQLTFALDANYKLVEIGPMSATWQSKANDPSTWTEVFSPDRDVTVRNFRLTHVQVKAGGGMESLPNPEDRLVKATDQKLNPDYPKTTPRGGTGKAHWIKRQSP